MEFGKLPSVDHINWTLPPDHESSIRYLKSLPQKAHKEFYIGAPSWANKEWIEKIYPPKTKAVDYLKYYAENFNSIELNTSHYRIPSEDKVKKWLQQIPKKFLFCPKVFQGISHHTGGLQDKALLKEWFSFLENLGAHCGPSFIQFPPHFDYSRKASLFHFLKDWPSEFELALEFRHPTWFQDHQILPALTEFLQTKKMGLVITDVAGRRDVLHTSISAPFVMLRFIGNDLHPSDFPRVHDWALRFQKWTELGLSRVFFFAHEYEDINNPELADVIVKELNQHCGAKLETLKWFSEAEQVALL